MTRSRPSLIQIQDEYIARVLACTTGHVRRVRIGARRAATAQLLRLGYSEADCKQIIKDAYDVLVLERDAVEG